MNIQPKADVNDKCILAYSHRDIKPGIRHLIVDFRQVPLALVGRLHTVHHRADNKAGSWLDVTKWLMHSLQYNTVGASSCSAVRLGQQHLTLELDVATSYITEAMAMIALYLDPYGINCEFVEL